MRTHTRAADTLSTPAGHSDGLAHCSTPTGYTRPWTPAECAMVAAGGAVGGADPRSGEVVGFRAGAACFAVGVVLAGGVILFLAGVYTFARAFLASLAG